MEIRNKTEFMEGTIEFDEDAPLTEVMDGITGSLIAQGYAVDSIRDVYVAWAWKLGWSEELEAERIRKEFERINQVQ